MDRVRPEANSSTDLRESRSRLIEMRDDAPGGWIVMQSPKKKGKATDASADDGYPEGL